MGKQIQRGPTGIRVNVPPHNPQAQAQIYEIEQFLLSRFSAAAEEAVERVYDTGRWIILVREFVVRRHHRLFHVAFWSIKNRREEYVCFEVRCDNEDYEEVDRDLSALARRRESVEYELLPPPADIEIQSDFRSYVFENRTYQIGSPRARDTLRFLYAKHKAGERFVEGVDIKLYLEGKGYRWPTPFRDVFNACLPIWHHCIDHRSTGWYALYPEYVCDDETR